jgi:hypothetical protein
VALDGAAFVVWLLWRQWPISVETVGPLARREGWTTTVQLAGRTVVTFKGDVFSVVRQLLPLLPAVLGIAILVGLWLTRRPPKARRRASAADRAFPDLPPAAFDKSPSTSPPPPSGIARRPGVAPAPDRVRPDQPG